MEVYVSHPNLSREAAALISHFSCSVSFCISPTRDVLVALPRQGHPLPDSDYNVKIICQYKKAPLREVRESDA
jgi:hypothetical protein